MRKFIQSLPHPIANTLLFARRLRSTFYEDGLLTITNADFKDDARFKRAYSAAKETGSFGNWNVRWRIHVLTWAADLATRVEGDFVECGTDHGGTAMAILHMADLSKRTFWLLDTFNGLDPSLLTEAEQRAGYFDYSDCFETVSRTFAKYPNVKLVRGSVPSTLPEVTAEKVAFLHLDMNSTRPEIAALEHFWPLMPEGAVCVMDDYGWPRHIEQKIGFDKFAEEHGIKLLRLPTSQAMFVKA